MVVVLLQIYRCTLHWSSFVTSEEIRSRTEQPALPDTIHSRRLSFLIISAALTPGKIITRLSRLAAWALLETGDGGLAGLDNSGLEPLDANFIIITYSRLLA